MKLKLNITFDSGSEQQVIAKLPEFAKWEKETGHKTSKAADVIGLWDMLFLAYHAAKRESAGKPMKNFDAWSDSVELIRVVSDESPKVLNPEA